MGTIENKDLAEGIVGEIDGSIIKDNSLNFNALKDGMMKLESEYSITDAGNNDIFQKFSERKLALVRGYVELLEVPDSAATTITMQISDGTNAASDALTFTEGTDAVGAVKAFTPTAANLFIENENIKAVVGGTSVTLGKVKVVLFFDRI